MEALTKCVLTGCPVQNFQQDENSFWYEIVLNGSDFLLAFCKRCYRRKKYSLEEFHHVFKGLLLNRKLELPDETKLGYHYDQQPHEFGELDLKKILEETIYPKTPKEKIDNLFFELYQIQKFEGDQININAMTASFFWEKCFLKNNSEFEYYLNALNEKELIRFFKPISKGDSLTCLITFEGLNYFIKTFEEGYNSKICFVAMSFSDDLNPVREAIKNAIRKTGFEPVIIDDIHIDSDKTINDEIFSYIKKSKFCIADFCHHRNGVYFECGFALGKGKPVIYTCRKDEFYKAHFDIKPLQQIIYETPDELENRLISKIEAWIK